MNSIHSTAIIHDCVHMGNDNRISPYCVLGAEPQVVVPCAGVGVSMGSRNTIREYASIDRSTKAEPTTIHSDNYIMAYCHVAHDCAIGDHNVLSLGATLAGFVEIQSRTTIGMNASIHQYRRIGDYSMVGMGAAITKDVPPYSVVYGGKWRGVNRTGLLRAGVKPYDIDGIEDWYVGGTRETYADWYVERLGDFIDAAEKVYMP